MTDRCRLRFRMGHVMHPMIALLMVGLTPRDLGKNAAAGVRVPRAERAKEITSCVSKRRANCRRKSLANGEGGPAVNGSGTAQTPVVTQGDRDAANQIPGKMGAHPGAVGGLGEFEQDLIRARTGEAASARSSAMCTLAARTS